MYITSLTLENFRTFKVAEIEFVHPDREWSDNCNIPKPRYPNINLLLGDNGSGKTSLLKAVALSALGPSIEDSGILPYRLIRRSATFDAKTDTTIARIEARFTPHDQDSVPSDIRQIESAIKISRRGDTERMRWDHPDDKTWHPVFSSDSDAFFFVGYGATRRVEKGENVDMGSRRQSVTTRALRVRSIFEEAYSLVPFTAWLPRLETENPGRHKQAVDLISKLLGDEAIAFTGEREQGEYVFDQQGIKIPYPALSDGYRAFLGWIGDLLYHVCDTCPSGKKLVDNQGIVMVDEIDLHLHPRWQLKVLGLLSQTLPNIQFILTSHSPLLVGSLEWMNIVVMDSQNESNQAVRIKEAIRGLDADQILLTEFFKLASTRTGEKREQLARLTEAARKGDAESALELLREMSRGLEE